ncbi:piggyBac transposable element-derived protein 4-like [Acyrthosiphon pisum]|uniref:PiggyBac transposable element-derived protein domain-containing protein n=1 Tax=Acyrthosiphon pisum TaxID=7029 RepID=A0A8R2NVM2_ACYPI|nr:piggyBac transposable element-derived protein 4-like [Acyrthosiphon pisum]
MDQKQIEDALSDSDFSFSDESIDDSDADPLFQLSESDDESSDHESLPVQLNADNDNISSNWYPVTGNYQKYFTYENDCTLPIELLANNEPYDYFKLFLTDDILNCMVLETNRNAEQYLKSIRLSRSSRFRSWQPIVLEDMTKFIGLLLWMGVVKYPNIADYWSKAERYENSVAPKIMSRNKFELILRFWHFADNETSDKSDRLYKIRNILDKINFNFEHLLTPGEIIAVDESMIPFRGRLKFRQYIPSKRHKYGVKLFKICDVNGFTYKIIIYEGKQSISGQSLGETIVLSLCEKYLEKGRTIVTDNFYTSVPLAKQLLNKKTHLVGTLRKNRRYLPKEVITKKIKKGEIFGKEDDNGIVVSKFKDKRDIFLLSTRHKLDIVDTGKQSRKKESILKPDVILFYNAGKAGIDLSDQLASYSSPVRKSIRWYHKVMTEILLNTSVINAQIMHNIKHNDSKMNVKQFRESLIDKMLDLKPTSRKLPQQMTTPNTLKSTGNQRRSAAPKHKIEETEEKCPRNRKLRKRCSECYKKISQEKGFR